MLTPHCVLQLRIYSENRHFFLISKWKSSILISVTKMKPKLIHTSEHLWTINNYLQNRSCSFLKTSSLGLTLQFLNRSIKNSSMFTIIFDYTMGWILWRTYIRAVGSSENLGGQVIMQGLLREKAYVLNFYPPKQILF